MKTSVPTVKIGINPHWYSQFWIKQFVQLWQQRVVKLRPLVGKKNPYASFYFEVNEQPCLIDVHDKKEPFFNPANYFMYFKAQFSPNIDYAENVRPCWNGTTLKHYNKLTQEPKEFDIVFISSISGGRYHKVALYEALAGLGLKTKLVVKMVSHDDVEKWGKYLEDLGVEVISQTMPYRDWVKWNKKGRWCVLTRGKHDCLSFKMLDYCSIGAAVVADYEPTSKWPVPIKAGENYINLNVPRFSGDEMDNPDYERLCELYQRRARVILPVLKSESRRQDVGRWNLDYFRRNIESGAAARHVLGQVVTELNEVKYEVAKEY